jgi:hypothetical protein
VNSTIYGKDLATGFDLRQFDACTDCSALFGKWSAVACVLRVAWSEVCQTVASCVGTAGMYMSSMGSLRCCRCGPPASYVLFQCLYLFNSLLSQQQLAGQCVKFFIAHNCWVMAQGSRPTSACCKLEQDLTTISPGRDPAMFSESQLQALSMYQMLASHNGSDGQSLGYQHPFLSQPTRLHSKDHLVTTCPFFYWLASIIICAAQCSSLLHACRVCFMLVHDRATWYQSQ